MRYITFLIYFLLLISNTGYTQTVSTAAVTNLSYISIPQYELPKRYIVDNYSTLYPQENPFRRADIVFFLSIPITMFIMQNIINIINTMNISLNNYNSDLGRDNFGYSLGEWNFIISALVMIPFGVMIYDTVYVKQYPIFPPFRQDKIKESRMNFSIYRAQF